jgi:putative SOS response-associated peptidase YedK
VIQTSGDSAAGHHALARGYTIVIITADAGIMGLYYRMPVILQPDDRQVVPCLRLDR